MVVGFIIGFLIGVLVGIMMLALVSINRKVNPDLNWKDMSLQEKKDLVAILSEDIMKVEPVSGNLKKAAEDYSNQECFILRKTSVLAADSLICCAKDSFVEGAQWQKKLLRSKVLLWLSDNISDWIDMAYDQNSFISELDNVME